MNGPESAANNNNKNLIISLSCNQLSIKTAHPFKLKMYLD